MPASHHRQNFSSRNIEQTSPRIICIIWSSRFFPGAFLVYAKKGSTRARWARDFFFFILRKLAQFSKIASSRNPFVWGSGRTLTYNGMSCQKETASGEVKWWQRRRWQLRWCGGWRQQIDGTKDLSEGDPWIFKVRGIQRINIVMNERRVAWVGNQSGTEHRSRTYKIRPKHCFFSVVTKFLFLCF